MSENTTPLRMTRAVVERLAQQTPCLCGDIDTWHRECYAGKSEEQIKAEYAAAFDKARRTLRARLQEQTRAAIAKASGVSS
jgi:hypothetical protein